MTLSFELLVRILNFRIERIQIKHSNEMKEKLEMKFETKFEMIENIGT